MPAPAASAPARDDHDHDHHDGCVCDHDLAEHEETGDADLPEAVGGIETKAVRKRRGTRAKIEGEA